MTEKNNVLGAQPETFEQRNTRHMLQATFTRFMNQGLAYYDFHMTQGPYTPYLVYDKDHTCHLIFGGVTFTWIDLKSPDLDKINSLLKKLWDNIENTDKTYIQQQLEKLGISPSKVTIETTKTKIRLVIDTYEQQKGPESEHIPAYTVKINNAELSAQEQQILKKLYFTTKKNRDNYFSKNENNEIALNEPGRKYYTQLLHDLYNHFKKTNSLGKNWVGLLFPDQAYSVIRNKITMNTLLTEKEITEFLIFILKPYTGEEIELVANGQRNLHTVEDKTKLMKKLLVNICYEALYDEQYYDYYTIHEIFSDRECDLPKDVAGAQAYTQKNRKSLGGTADKGLRRQEVRDLIRSRTFLPDEQLLGEQQQHIILQNFQATIDDLKQAATQKGYTLHIEDIDVVSKFPRQGTCPIVISEDSVAYIQQQLRTAYTPDSQTTPGKRKKQKSVSTDTNLENYKGGDEKKALVHVFTNEDKKGGGNQGYADIKIKVTYSLVDNKTQKTFENTGGFEHMIVNYASTNEGGLSDHTIILDPKKWINEICRTNSTIGLDVFSERVTGGLTNLVLEMSQRKDRLAEPVEKRPTTRPPRSFIEKQFTIRNDIPKELLPESLQGKSLTYSDLDKKPVIKKAIEKQIEEYLLDLMFKEGTLVWYCHEVDLKNMGDSGIEMKFALNDCEKDAYTMNKDLLQEALTAPPEQRKYYRFTGGGNGNLKNMLIKGTLPLNSYIGFPDPANLNIIHWLKTERAMGVIADNLTVEQKNSSV